MKPYFEGHMNYLDEGDHVRIHYENMPIQYYIEKLTSKNWKFSDNKTLIFFILLLKTLIVDTR